MQLHVIHVELLANDFFTLKAVSVADLCDDLRGTLENSNITEHNFSLCIYFAAFLEMASKCVLFISIEILVLQSSIVQFHVLKDCVEIKKFLDLSVCSQ